MSYLSNISKEIKTYLEILESDFPKWLEEYIETPALLRSASISNNCGMIYTDLIPSNFFYSNLDHSVAVALVVWHFTRDKKQTLAGLFHDIATPAFKHCVDVMDGDGEKQESLEKLTPKFIEDSPEIMKLLERDDIKLEEVSDYHVYPIADNDSPRLAADRLEYSLSNALLLYNKLNLNEVREIYNDIEIEINEDNLPELGFKTKKNARKFVRVTCEMSIIYRDERPRYSMRFIADILKDLSGEGVISRADLFEKKESEIINIIEKSKYGEVFKKWRKAKKVETSKAKPEGVYSVKSNSKVRFIDPLVKGERISKICKIVKGYIEKNLAYDMSDYVYLNLKMPESQSDKLRDFLINAKKATYANKSALSIKASRQSSTDYEYKDDDMVYHDTYFGGNNFMGEEIVYKGKEPVWGMNYYGRLLGSSDEIFGQILRPALMRVGENATLPLRGPKEFFVNNYRYTFEVTGDLDGFSGVETIYENGVKLYELICHGGKLEK